MTRPDGFWNDKTNLSSCPPHNDDTPERTDWMHWAILAIAVIGAIGIMGSWYGNGAL